MLFWFLLEIKHYSSDHHPSLRMIFTAIIENAVSYPCQGCQRQRTWFGKTKFAPVLKTLVKNGYKGYISVEVFEFDPDPQTIASRSLGYLRGILEAFTQ